MTESPAGEIRIVFRTGRPPRETARHRAWRLANTLSRYAVNVMLGLVILVTIAAG